MVTCALGKSFWTAIANTWEVVWRMRLSLSDSLVRGSLMGAVSSWGAIAVTWLTIAENFISTHFSTDLSFYRTVILILAHSQSKSSSELLTDYRDR